MLKVNYLQGDSIALYFVLIQSQSVRNQVGAPPWSRGIALRVFAVSFGCTGFVFEARMRRKDRIGFYVTLNSLGDIATR